MAVTRWGRRASPGWASLGLSHLCEAMGLDADGPPSADRVRAQQPAVLVAKAIDQRAGRQPSRRWRRLVKAGGAPAPKRPAPQDQIKQAQEQMKQMRELFQKRKDDAARKAGGLQSR